MKQPPIQTVLSSPLINRLRPAVKTAVRVVSRTILAAAGNHVDPASMLVPTAVIAPHPDDETFGCGALIARLRAADVPVCVVVVSDGAQGMLDGAATAEALTRLREVEAITAMSALGVDPGAVHFLGFRDGALADERAAISAAVADTIAAAGAEQVLVTSAMDRHPDHAAVALATRDAQAALSRPVSVFEYPIWQRLPALSIARGAIRDAHPGPGFVRRLRRLRPVLVATGGFLAAKREAIDAYPSQLPLLPVGFVADFTGRTEVFVPVV